MDRRKFLGWVTVGTLASSLPVVIAACTSNANSGGEVANSEAEKNDSVSQPSNSFVIVGTSEELAENGSIFQSEKNLIVVRNIEDNSLVAFNSKCTHQGCDVKWNQEENNLICPCHDSRFAIDGKAIAGPADQPLAKYEVKEENGEILVKSNL
jgi:cytochrome b6-f complex iron-sulfur subunit